MYKILFVAESLAQDGTQTFMMNVLRYIDRNTFPIDFCLFLDVDSPNRAEAKSYGCNIYILPSRRQNPLIYLQKSIAFFKEHAKEYQAIHWNGGNLSSILVLVLSRLFKIPVRIVHAHSSSASGSHNLILHKIHRFFLPILCNRNFACSTEASEFFFGKRNSVIINNGIDTSKFDYNLDVRRQIRKELGIEDDYKVLGHVGRFDDNKNQTFILDVFQSYNLNNPNSYLVLVGEGETLDAVKQKARECNIENRVLFLGIRTDVNRIMQAMDCFLMPSKYEGLPFVLVEAQCSGLYCIVSDTISRDVALTNNVKFLSLHSEKQEWSKNIDNALENYNRKSQKKLLVAKGFSINENIKYLESIYSNSV